MKKEVISTILRMVFAAAGIVFIISMIMDQAQPYLTIGLGFVVLANIICWVLTGYNKKKGN